MTKLKDFLRVSTSKVEEAEYLYEGSIAKAKILDIADRSNFNLRFLAVHLGKTRLISSNLAVTCRMESALCEDQLRFVLGNTIPPRFCFQGKTRTTSSKRAVIVQQAPRVEVDREAGSETIVVGTSHATLKKHLETLTNTHQSGPLSFYDDTDMRRGSGAFLQQMVQNLLFEISYNESMLMKPGIMKGFDEFFNIPHNFSNNLYFSEKNSFSPNIVVHAEDYMHANFEKHLLISDILKECNCSRKELFSSFRRSRDYTPMMFLNEQRLQAARQKILTSDPQVDSISDIAYASGFTHLGRFSRSYAKRFGELPSETFRRQS